MASRIRAVAFDLDGTLVDSRLDFAELRRHLGWPAGTLILEHLSTITVQHEKAIAEQVIIDFEMEGAKLATWMPGAQELVAGLKQMGVPMGIFTRNMSQATAMCVSTLGIPIELVVTRDDAPAKPHPEGLLLIAEKLGVEPAELLYVGDFLFDIQTARNAGSPCCLFRYGDNGIYAEQADFVVDDLRDILQLVAHLRKD